MCIYIRIEIFKMQKGEKKKRERERCIGINKICGIN